MKLTRTINIALTALRRNILRSALTTLGIIIGIAAVIAMIEIGKGSSVAIQKTIQSMGANTLLVIPGTAASGGVSFGAGSSMTLTPEDSSAIIENVATVLDATPVVRARAQLVYGAKNWVPMNIYGTTPSFLVVREWETLAEGEMFTDRDVRNSNKVCLLGQTIVRELFGSVSPIGKEIRIQSVPFTIIGVLSKKGANMAGIDQDDIVLAPWTSIKYRISGTSSASSQAATAGSTSPYASYYPSTQINYYPQQVTDQANGSPSPIRFTNVDQILLKAESAEKIEETISQITKLLRERHNIRAGEPDDFSIRNMSEMTKALASTASVMTRLLLGVSIISLVVGGVGIMNIMLVSVTERTREIGLRLAVGARPEDILHQFLVEAVVLCIIGGLLGILLGRGCSLLIWLILGWPTQFSLPALIASVIVSVSVGIGFGFYPAWKASKLDPIEALRWE